MQHTYKNTIAGDILDIATNNKLYHETLRNLPRFDLTHIFRLTNRTGILQHAKYATPNYHHGYCVDDNARALLLMALAIEQHPSDSELVDKAYTYLAFIYYMQLENGDFRNFLSFDLRFLDEKGTEDSFGRTVWALGYVLGSEKMKEFQNIASDIFFPTLKHIENLRSPRSVGYCLMGLLNCFKAFPDNKEVYASINQLSEYLLKEYQQNSSEDWIWYEKVLSYDNAVLPLAMLYSGRLLQCNEYLDIGMRTAHFLDGLVYNKEHLSIIGNEGWYRQDGQRSQFAQQPIEVASTLLLYQQLYEETDMPIYLQRVATTFDWFMGKNDLNKSMYDPLSKGCYDGLGFHGPNLNQGAESSISFWTSYIYTRKSFK